jgi:acyl-CoA hydrolase
VRWNYGHTTIPRHLRDIYLNEYGIADLRGLTDEDCVHAMTAITEAPFQGGLLQQAHASRKLLAASQPIRSASSAIRRRHWRRWHRSAPMAACRTIRWAATSTRSSRCW